MQRWKKFIPISLVIIMALLFLYFVTGYRLTALNAAKSNAFVTHDYKLVDQYKTDSFAIFLFKSDAKEMYRTVLSKRSGFLYRSNASTYIHYQKGPLVTVGGMSVSGKYDSFTFLRVKSNDADVTYIVAGTGTNQEKKKIKKGERISFLFQFDKQIDHLNARAFNDKGKELYYYGYPKNTSVFRPQELKWHKVNGS